jgi:uncharacterized protein
VTDADTVEPGHPEADPSRPAFDRRMLESLVCPVTQGRLRYDAAAAELISPTARLAFPIRNGIPIMLASEAREIE